MQYMHSYDMYLFTFSWSHQLKLLQLWSTLQVVRVLTLGNQVDLGLKIRLLDTVHL